jgi:hypothetical protein
MEPNSNNAASDPGSVGPRSNNSGSIESRNNNSGSIESRNVGPKLSESTKFMAEKNTLTRELINIIAKLETSTNSISIKNLTAQKRVLEEKIKQLEFLLKSVKPLFGSPQVDELLGGRRRRLRKTRRVRRSKKTYRKRR